MMNSLIGEKQLAYLRVVFFSMAGFVFITTEFVPIALLSSIAHSFNMKVEEVGQMIAIYAWVVAIASLPLMLLTARFERKKLLMWLFVIFFISHMVSALSPNFYILLASRIGVATTHAIFWAIASSLAIRVAPEGKETLAVSMVSLGAALASILGLPIGRIIGEYFSWQTSFGVIGLASVMLALLMWKLLPELPSKNAGSVKMLPVILKRPLLMSFYVLTLLSITAHFTAYSYIEPFAIQVAGVMPSKVAYLLLTFGFSGVIGSLLFNRYFNKWRNTYMLSCILVVMVSTLLLLDVGKSAEMLSGLLLLWGIGVTGFGLSFQLQIIRITPDATDMAVAIYSGIYNVGIALGAMIGGWVISGKGITLIGYYAGALSVVTLLWFAFMWRRFIHNK